MTIFRLILFLFLLAVACVFIDALYISGNFFLWAGLGLLAVILVLTMSTSTKEET